MLISGELLSSLVPLLLSTTVLLSILSLSLSYGGSFYFTVFATTSTAALDFLSSSNTLSSISFIDSGLSPSPLASCENSTVTH